ncbi:DUF1573 domain-containing protein [Riemerella columbina]|uniref:DUF1573 domain-containing protein n=1 Tax=Riemerella columbina TaxID=103810 RepID=UPI00266EB32C|nr:DUF1573 domain-containing protein [Riemerella columbina]WKS94992.1 DUF1573 domain-containing protein [Riemerella columbina]
MKHRIKISLVALGFLSLSACKKEQQPEVVETETIEAVAEPTPVDDMVAEAQKAPLTTVALSEPNFDFGVVKSGAIVEHTYEITNTGDKPLIISNVKPGCGCTAPDFTKTPILPGQSGKVTLKFNSASFNGVQHKFAQVFTNTEKTPITLTFTADVQ